MKILVTGANGFIGKYVIKSLLGSSNSLKIFAVSQGLNNETTHKNLTWIKLDLHDYGATYSALKETAPDVLIHLAWYAEHGKFWTSLENLKWVSTTINLLRNFNEFGGKKVFISGTCAEYDYSPSPCIEDITPIRPQTIYGKCKDLTHQITKDLCVNWDLELIWGRIFIPYGLGESLKRLIPSSLKAMNDGLDINATHGNQLRDFIHASDVANAITLLSISKAPAGAYNISSGKAVSIKKILEICQKNSKKASKIKYGSLPLPSHETQFLVGCNNKLTKAGWKNQNTVENGILKYSEFFKKID
jgi:nucleoside-diphosphate-sugar epimerase